MCSTICYDVHMALKPITLVTLHFLGTVTHAAFSPIILEVKFGGSVTLPCNGAAYRGSSEKQLDVLWRMSNGKNVSHYSHGRHSVGLRFEQRVLFSSQRIKAGDFSLAVSSVSFGDEDTYECVWRAGQEGEKLLNSVELRVLAPFFPNSQSVSPGDPVTLPCYGRVPKKAPEDELSVQWKKGDELVLQLDSGEFTCGKNFSQRASMSLDKIRLGDFSLLLSITGLSDKGTYRCSNDHDQTLASISFSLKDHQTRFIVEPGSTFSLSVPRVPVKVRFVKVRNDVGLCDTFEDFARCTKSYSDRMEFKNWTLKMRGVQPSDEGRYKVFYNDILIKTVSLEVSVALPKAMYIFSMAVSLCLLGLVMKRQKCGPKQIIRMCKLSSSLLK
ncbi:hypothetical protein GJAV_G00025210 [Gymnothorax javanicus]|nr:hypothetical protein GJAV_G00025210 [Gymnothorax javanicus]